MTTLLEHAHSTQCLCVHAIKWLHIIILCMLYRNWGVAAHLVAKVIHYGKLPCSMLFVLTMGKRIVFSWEIHYGLLKQCNLTAKFRTVGTLDLYMFISCQVALMASFDWLVGSPLMKAEWRSALMECGGQCVMIAGGPVMPELSAGS